MSAAPLGVGAAAASDADNGRVRGAAAQSVLSADTAAHSVSSIATIAMPIDSRQARASSGRSPQPAGAAASGDRYQPDA